MVQMNGTYQLVKNENLKEQLVAYKIAEEHATKADAVRPKLEVNISGDQVTLKSDSGIENSSTILTLNKEVDEKLPLQFTVKSTASIQGDTLIVKSVNQNGVHGVRTYKFTDSELVITIEATGFPTAKRFYKRV